MPKQSTTLKRWLLPVISLLLPMMVLAGGCTTSGFGTRKTLEVSGSVAVDVVTFGGDVKVIATGRRQVTPFVLITPESHHAIHRNDEARASLEEIDWDIEVVNEGGRDVVRIRTSTLYREPALQRVHVTVGVPELDGIRVKTRLGHVEINESTGPIDIETTKGDIEIVTTKPAHGPISAVTTDGDIQLRVPPGSSGRLDCYTGDGRIISSVPTGRLQVQGRSNDQILDAILNDGTSPIVLRTNDGTIRVIVKKNPYEQSSLLLY